MAEQLSDGATIVRLGAREIDLMGGETIGAVAAAAAAAALATALIAQYGFGLLPCELCLWQRYPYLVGLGLALPALFLRNAPRRLLFAGAALVFAIGLGLAVYHSLVEWKLVDGLASCDASSVDAAQSFEDFMGRDDGGAIVSCTARTPWLFGLTMTNWNAIVSADIATLFALAAARARRR